MKNERGRADIRRRVNIRREVGALRWRITLGTRARKSLCTGVPLAILLLTGCAGPHYLTRSCITKEQYEQLKREQPPKIHDKLTGKADEDTRPLAGSIIQLRSYSGMLLGVLETCAGPPNNTK